MNKIHFILAAFLMLILSCGDAEFTGQYPVDSTPPQEVSDVEIENLKGGVKIKYQLPDETDLLYVKAVYTKSNGDISEERASVYKNTIEIKGFGKQEKQQIKLISVDRSQNESQPILVEIEPEDASVYFIRETIKATSSWGGFNLVWENSSKEDVIVRVLEKNEEGEWKNLESFYSAEEEANRSVRGLEDVPQTFGITVEDLYLNKADTLFVDVLPLFEEQIPVDGVVELPLNPLYKLSIYGGNFTVMFDDQVQSLVGEVNSRHYYLAPSSNINPFFSFDLGVKAKLSRFRYWGRPAFAYSLHNLRYFELWGSNLPPEEVTDYDNWEGWEIIRECESYKPSGPGAILQSDKEYFSEGEEYEVGTEIPAYRYFRLRCTETWTKSNGLIVSELTFWGKVVE